MSWHTLHGGLGAFGQPLQGFLPLQHGSHFHLGFFGVGNGCRSNSLCDMITRSSSYEPTVM